jgi:hypothetical protein
MNQYAKITLISLASIIALLIVFMIYVKIKYRFWSIQPVFHFYDVYYWFFSVGIIRHHLPEKNKFCNFENIETKMIQKVKDYQFSKFLNIIRGHFLRNDDNEFLPQLDNIMPYFAGHNSPCFFSFYWEKILLQESPLHGSNDVEGGTNTIEDKKLIGCMTSRPLHIRINNGNKNAFFDAYYVDYLCVDKNERKKGVAPQIIQTHEYNQCHLNDKIQVSLFKREDQLTGIVPLTAYSTYGFSMRNWNALTDLPANVTLIECNPQNLYYLHDFVKRQCESSAFDIYIIPEFTNVAELIKTQNIYIYMILNGDDVMAAYFFRKSCVFIRKGEQALTCFASINGGLKNDLFVHGYKAALLKIRNRVETVESYANEKNKKKKKSVTFQTHYNFAVVENISHNDAIIKNLVLKTHPEIISPTAYFFYNFAYSTFRPRRVFILN